MSDNRKIIHIDMDAFYASVEQRDFPELQGKPIAVGGGGMRGVVASASYEARRYGVRSAMPSVTAKRLCPELIFVKARFDVYRNDSQAIREIFLQYTDLVEPLSLDEAYLDVTDPKKGPHSATLIAEEIRNRIVEETGLTASAGVSFNKFLAKIASDINKPNGIKIILPDEAMDFLGELPVRKFHGVGKVTAEKMERMGIYKGEDLRQYSEVELVKRFGKVGSYYFHIVRAEDNRPVNPNRIRKSIGAERTFAENETSMEGMRIRLQGLVERVFQYMDKTGNFGRTVTLKMKKPDFTILTRSKTFSRELKSVTELEQAVQELLEQNWSPGLEVRLLGVSVSNLQLEDQFGGVQLEFEF